MALYLDDTELNYLLKTLKSFHSSYWVVDKIIGKIEDDMKRKEITCEHEESTYIGHKTCCKKCGFYFLPGQGESWQLQASSSQDVAIAGSE